MYLIRVLKRRDAASVIVAIVVAMVLMQFVLPITGRLSSWIVGSHNGPYFGFAGPGGGWKDEYLFPLVAAVVQLLALEVLIWVYVWVPKLVIKPFKK